MYNIRYHIASLVSVFIALALGLVLGGLIVDDGTARSNQAIVESLQADFAAVREQSAKTQKENDLLSHFINESTPLTIQGQLSGYAVIVMQGETKATDEVTRVVTLAGGTVIPVSLDEEKLAAALPESATATLIDELAKSKTEEGAFDATAELARELAKEWTDHTLTVRPYTDALTGEGILVMPALDWATTQVLGAVEPTGTKEEIVQTLSLEVLQAMSDLGFSAVVASVDSEADVPLPELQGTQPLSTLNALGTPIGSYTLVSLLKGAQPGVYGTMKGAVSSFALMPVEVKYAGKPLVVPEAEPTPAP